ncbi:Retinoic acid receptor gamma-A [Anabarilius grahami]|uniref:Retinoic acid receptor gamma-A n=1 Tax=Anabarilius grahami TaxID=495550 RepID=A0A3N0Z2I4_ANAGA|nr:Retinoic acid receptor gamma-A [Anabarilius grahami]
MFDCMEALGMGPRQLYDVTNRGACMLRKASPFYAGLDPFAWTGTASSCLTNATQAHTQGPRWKTSPPIVPVLLLEFCSFLVLGNSGDREAIGQILLPSGKSGSGVLLQATVPSNLCKQDRAIRPQNSLQLLFIVL